MSKILVLGSGVIGLSTAMMLDPVRPRRDRAEAGSRARPHVTRKRGSRGSDAASGSPGNPTTFTRPVASFSRATCRSRGGAPPRGRHHLQRADAAAAVHRGSCAAPRGRAFRVGDGAPSRDRVRGGQRRRQPTGGSSRSYGTGLLSGPSAASGIPHVTGVRTSGGEALAADLVIDAMGRRSTFRTGWKASEVAVRSSRPRTRGSSTTRATSGRRLAVPPSFARGS